MRITNKIKMDLTKPNPTLSVNAVQGDAYSRSLHIALYTGFQPWKIPDNVSVAIRYAKPDRTKGYYDTMPDGTSAWSIQENILTIRLAPQMLTVPGNVRVQMELIRESHILSTFSLTVHVEANPAAGVLGSEDYTNWLEWIQEQSALQVAQIQQSVQDAATSAAASATSAVNASGFADSASIAAGQALDAATSAASIREETRTIAGNVSAIVAGNEAYTKQESDIRYSPAIRSTVTGTILSLPDSLEQSLQGMRLYGKTTQSSTPSADNPAELISVGSNGSIRLKVTEKNLLPNDAVSQTIHGITFTVNADKSVTANGTASQQATLVLKAGRGWIIGGSYTGTGCPSGGSTNSYYLRFSDNVKTYNDYGSGVTTVLADDAYHYVQITIVAGKTVNNLTFYPMLRFANVLDGTYEPYREPQTVSLSIPGDLQGIPVSSGGNYTDESGQQWICDEVDISQGVYLQRIGKLDSYSDEELNGEYLSSTGALTDGATVLYPLEQPVQTALAAEVLADFAAVHTYYPCTGIISIDNAGLSLCYMADTRLYIRDQIQQALTRHLSE